MPSTTSPPAYPRLLRRVRAALIDSVVFIALFFGWFFSIGTVEAAHPVLKVGALLLGVVLLEPGLVSRTGGTVGHHLMGLRIQDSTSGQNIGIIRAGIRAIIRVVLGAFSLIFILATRRHQAIHDSAYHSVVVLRYPDRIAESERFQERELVPQGFELPSALRRMTMILVYGLLSLLLFSILLVVFLSAACVDFNVCTPFEDTISLVLSVSWFASLVPIVILAWKGRLFGCHRRRTEGS